MKQVLISSGQVKLSEVPNPTPQVGEVMVQVEYSCLSAGTEMAGITSSAVPLWKKAYKDPNKALQTIKSLETSPEKIWQLVNKKKNQVLPTGYSAAGRVVSLGKGVKGISVGDRIACSGSESAFHAEFISVPENLCTKIPDKVPTKIASTVTMGAIAMQGIRRASPQLGETFVVIGLGLLGQLTTQILKANGCRVIAIDLEKEKLSIAKDLGADCVASEKQEIENYIASLTQGYGADGIIITAASDSDEIISQAFKYSRKKGRVVIVGDIGLKLNRSDFYEKEIDIFISASYGPGRYDKNYEIDGLDYPISYVRWTENRNMQEYLKLISEGKMQIEPLISNVFNIEKVVEAYKALEDSNPKPIINLLEYSSKGNFVPSSLVKNNFVTKKSTHTQINIAIIGAGEFTTSTHIPNLNKLKKDFSISHVINRNGYKAMEIAKSVNSEFASTDYFDALNDDKVNAVLISTKHDQHSDIVIEALKANKNVFVEKPIALNETELLTIDDTLKAIKGNPPLVMTGFNRRFSPIMTELYQVLKKRKNPFIMNYVMNAGFIPPDHWTQGKEGGGRNIGEACHIYDLFIYLAGCEASKVEATQLKDSDEYKDLDNFSACISFTDGSVCNLIYSSMGSLNYPKENSQIFVDGKVITMEDYRYLNIYDRGNKISKTFKGKGHMQELEQFSKAIILGGEWPIPWNEQILSSKISFEIEDKIQS